MAKVIEHGLRHDLGLPVRAVGLEPRRFRDRDGWRNAVDGRRGGVHYPCAVEFLHRLQ